MSIGNKFFDWCRIPPEPPKNRHRKLLATSLIFTILGTSILVSLGLFYGGVMVGSVNTFAASGTVLSIASLGEGPKYIQNASYQPIAEINNSTEFYRGEIAQYSCDDVGNINITLINCEDQNWTISSIEIYRDGKLFALINGSFIIGAHTAGVVNLQLCNLTELSKTEVVQPTLTRTSGSCNVTVSYPWPYSWRPTLYTIVFNAPEGVVWRDDSFTFPTAPNPSYLFDAEGNSLGWPVKPPGWS